MLIFAAVIKDTKRIIVLKTLTKTVNSKGMSVYLLQRAFTVHELLPLIRKILVTTMKFHVMS